MATLTMDQTSLLVERATPVGRSIRRRVLTFIAEYSVLIGITAMFAFPFLFLILQSLMPAGQAKTGDLWPSTFEWHNYVEVFQRIPLAHYFANSLLICVATTVGVVVSSLPVAYAFSMLRWRGREVVFIVVLVTMTLPYQALFVPQFQIFSGLGWVGTYLPLIVPSFLADAFSIFLLRQFLLTLPTDVIEAARIDGAGELQILARIVFPMAKPAIMAVALFQFLGAWGDFFGPLIYVNDPNLMTLAVGIQAFQSEVGRLGESNLTLAACTVFVLPVIILFMFAQKAFIEGVNFTGSKG